MSIFKDSQLCRLVVLIAKKGRGLNYSPHGLDSKIKPERMYAIWTGLCMGYGTQVTFKACEPLVQKDKFFFFQKTLCNVNEFINIRKWFC